MSEIIGSVTFGDLLTVSEAAAITRMSKSWWRQQVFRKQIDFHKIGRSVRIPRSSVEAVLAASFVPARPTSAIARANLKGRPPKNLMF